jgi:hypothetical protein
MTVTSATPGADREDPLYAEGMAHFQAGEWGQAVRCFESLAGKYPGSKHVSGLLEEARFKAHIATNARVRARRWSIPWRRILWRTTILVVLVALAVEGYFFLQREVAPAIAQAQAQRLQASLLSDGNAQLASGDLDAADASFNRLLALVPGDKDALAGLERVKTERAWLALYNQAAAQQANGDLAGALASFTQLSVSASSYRDVAARIADIKQQLDLNDLVAAADADYAAGNLGDAAAKYEQISSTNANYRSDYISGRLFEIYMALGRQIVQRQPPAPDQVPQALDDFSHALALQPRDDDALTEQHLASLFVQGTASYQARQWNDAIFQLGAVYAERATYLGGKVVVDPLYDAYIQSGDAYRSVLDYYRAWDQYHHASELPVTDTSLARGRMASVLPYLTPTPTPTVTPTPTLVPTGTPFVFVMPSDTPTPTPVPLDTLHGQILFWSNSVEQGGKWVPNPDGKALWAIQPDGSGRRYLGPAGIYGDQYDALYQKESLSPDGRYRVYNTTDTTRGDLVPEIYIQGPPDSRGIAQTTEVTHLSKMSYQPAWSPDGSRIAFVSEDHGTDEVWTVAPDGSELWDRTPSTWQWNKHPSWSPDSTQIVFWTNREGTDQIYVMDADGHDQHNISMVPADEYDPLWVK